MVPSGQEAAYQAPRQSFVNVAHTNLSVMDALSVAVAGEGNGNAGAVRHLDLNALSALETNLGSLAPKLVALRQGLMTVSLPVRPARCTLDKLGLYCVILECPTELLETGGLLSRV